MHMNHSGLDFAGNPRSRRLLPGITGISVGSAEKLQLCLMVSET